MEDNFKLPRISVLIVTYNQQDLIGRAIESVLNQKDYVFEIVICDDKSTDGNWAVINNYAKNYPNLIKAYRNEKNLGIFQNMERKWELAKGDIVYDLSGDDEVGNQWFKDVVDFININQIDYKSELFCIYGNNKCIYPNGDSYTFKNNQVLSNLNLLKLYERGLISNRACCYSVKILDKFHNVSQAKSFVAENAQDAQLHIFTQKAYYLPVVGNIYHTNIGVSRKMNEERLNQHQNTMIYAFSFFDSIGVQYDILDSKLPHYNVALKKFRRKKSLFNFIKVVKLYFIVYDSRIGFRDLKIRKLLFSIARRIPHKTPMSW